MAFLSLASRRKQFQNVHYDHSIYIFTVWFDYEWENEQVQQVSYLCVCRLQYSTTCNCEFRTLAVSHYKPLLEASNLFFYFYFSSMSVCINSLNVYYDFGPVKMTCISYKKSKNVFKLFNIPHLFIFKQAFGNSSTAIRKGKYENKVFQKIFFWLKFGF